MGKQSQDARNLGETRSEGPGLQGEGAFEAAWVELSLRLEPSSSYARHWPETLTAIKEAADPDLAFATWSRWIEAGLSASEASGVRECRWDESPAFREGFIALAGASPALGNFLLTLWEDFHPARWQAGWETKTSLARRIASVTDRADDKEFPDVVRQFQRIEGLRIAYLDVVQEMPVERVTLQISSLADTLIAACYDRALRVVAKRRGLAPPLGGFAVVALGKLGGMELNYSSDVDLNFIYDEAFQGLKRIDGARVDDPLELERFFTQVAERLVQLITAFTDKGQLYRLDARLRPEGSSGRLVWSARASIDYYYSMGRTWERQALIRMRPVAGEIVLAERLRRELDAFVFPPNLSADEVAEIRGLKHQMEKLAEDRGPSEDQIKIGRGGIRDVEYIVQYLQLLQASRVPALKKANIFQALELLEAEGLLKPEETDVLRRGYRFLRKVEHRIQMAHLRQTHRLPEDPRELLRLARGLEFKTIEAFRGRLQRHAAQIRRVYHLLFEEATAPRREVDELPALLDLPEEVSVEAGAGLLSAFGFNDPRGAFLRLRALCGSGATRATLDAHRSKEVFRRLAGKLLREVSLQAEPDRTLSNFEECVRTLGARSVFFQLLAESDRILQLFVEICARSTLVVERLRAYPELFDELVDALATGYTFSRESLIAEGDRLCRESAAFERDIFKCKHLHLLLIAIQDLERIDNLSTTLLHIAELAEALLHAILFRTLKEAEGKLGAWASTPPEYLVLGLGKLGGQEMNYKSDVDIVLLYRGEGKTRQGTTAHEYFEKLSQMVLQQAGLSDSFGPLLKVDLRLRPLGGHNSLAISLEAWQQYFQGGQARTWERQAFLRARPVAGSAELATDVMTFIRRELVLGGSAGPHSRAEAIADIRKMRQKLESHAKAGDLKRGTGGIMDVEFLVQALQLCHGKEHPGILIPNTAAAIRKLMDAGLLGLTQGSALLTSYQFLRWIENRISLVGEANQSLSSLSPETLESLAQKIGYKSTGEESALAIFQSELEYHRRVNRRELERVLTPSPPASP